MNMFEQSRPSILVQMLIQQVLFSFYTGKIS